MKCFRQLAVTCALCNASLSQRSTSPEISCLPQSIHFGDLRSHLRRNLSHATLNQRPLRRCAQSSQESSHFSLRALSFSLERKNPKSGRTERHRTPQNATARSVYWAISGYYLFYRSEQMEHNSGFNSLSLSFSFLLFLSLFTFFSLCFLSF